MHDIQKRLLSLATLGKLEGLTYRDMAALVGANHASQVKHHLEQLIKKGMIVRSSAGSLLAMSASAAEGVPMLSFPVLGEADCGEATKYASDRVEGYLRVSPSVVSVAGNGLYALRARGSSMNKAEIGSRKAMIHDGDYVLVSQASLGNVRSGDYVVSLIDGMANIKRLYIDQVNERIILNPESSDDFHMPIVIADADLDDFKVLGVVCEVVQGIGTLAAA